MYGVDQHHLLPPRSASEAVLTTVYPLKIGINSMDNSPLQRLPPELRDRIYEFVTTQDEQISIIVRTGKPVTRGLDLRFMTVCKQMRDEANAIFYNANAFTIVTKYLETEGETSNPLARKSFSGIQSWLAAIGPDGTKSLSRVCLDLGWYTVEGEHSRISELMNLAKHEIQLLSLPRKAVVLRAAYFIEVFPPIAHLMRYIDIPLSDIEAARQKLETTTSNSKKNMPPYAFNREIVHTTMELFKNGIFDIVFACQ